MLKSKAVVITAVLAIALWASTAVQVQAQGQSLEKRVEALEAAVAALQSNGAQAIAPYVSVQTGSILGLAGPHVIFTGANIHIRSGSGCTDDGTSFGRGCASGTLTGLGNLVVGYDESGGRENRSGSHNLVVGPLHTFSSWGGMLAGFQSTVGGASSSVIGGRNNTASGNFSSVIGGTSNTASGNTSSVTGGEENKAPGVSGSVTGGFGNTSGDFASVSGGVLNTASGRGSSVSGGESNTASGDESSVSGGANRSATGTDNWAAGILFQPN